MHKGGPRAATVVYRRARALEMRIACYTYRQIAEELEYASEQQAYEAVRDEMAKAVREPVAALREQELDRLNKMLYALWPNIEAGNQGAIQTGLRVMERRAKLLGMDAPIDYRVVREEAQRLADELGLDRKEVMAEAEAIIRSSGGA